MANTAQLLRRQSSRDIVLKSQKSIDQLELRVSGRERVKERERELTLSSFLL